MFTWPHAHTVLRNGTTGEIRSVHGIVNRDRTRWALHRFLWFNLWDDRHLFHYATYRSQEKQAKQAAKQLAIETTPLLWRTRYNGTGLLHIDRPIWVCIHQQELYSVVPRCREVGNELVTFTLSPVADNQPFAALPVYIPRKTEPNLRVHYKVHGTTHRSKTPPRWERPIPLIHPEIVGPDRVLMMHLYMRGLKDAEVLSMVKEHGEGHKVSKDFKKYATRIKKELYNG